MEPIEGYCLVGIDPGADGAIAAFWPSAGLLGVWDIPKVQRGSHQRVNGYAVRSMLDWISPNSVWMEAVHSMPRDGHVGAFSFGHTAGKLEGVIEAGLLLNISYVEPNVWKTNLRAPVDKNLSRDRAKALFPECAKLFSRPDKAEACMIGLYGLFRQRVVNLPTFKPIMEKKPW